MSAGPAASPVPTVRLIVPDASGRVLLIRRANAWYGEGRWCLPGGKVDYGETVEDAVARELQEETALELTRSRFLFYQDSPPRTSGQMHCINLYFECGVRGEIQLNDEADASTWVREDELSRYEVVFRNDDGLREYWKERAETSASPSVAT